MNHKQVWKMFRRQDGVAPLTADPFRFHATTRKKITNLIFTALLAASFEPIMGFINHMKSGKSLYHFKHAVSISNHLGMREFQKYLGRGSPN